MIVQVICGESCGDGHTVGNVTILLLGEAVADLLQPSCVVQNNEHFIVHLILGKERIVASAELFYLFIDDSRFANEVAHPCCAMLQPESACLDITVVVLLIIEDKNVEFLISQDLSMLGLGRLSSDLDLVLCLSDVRLKIVVV